MILSKNIFYDKEEPKQENPIVTIPPLSTPIEIYSKNLERLKVIDYFESCGKNCFRGNVKILKDLNVEGNAFFNCLDTSQLYARDASIRRLTVKEAINLPDNLTLKNLKVTGNTVLAFLEVGENAIFNKDVKINGTTTVNNLKINGVLQVYNVLIGGNLQVAGNTQMNNLLVNGTANFKEDVTIDKDLTVVGTLNLTDLALSGNLQVDGNTILGSNNTQIKTNAISVLTVNAIATFNEDVTMEKDLIVNGKIYITDLTLTGDLQVDGNTTIGSNAVDTLTVNATTTFKNNVTILGALSLTDLTLTGNLQVDGNTILGSDATDTLTVNATTTFKEDVTIEKDLLVDGKMYLIDLTLTGDLIVEKNTILGSDATDTLTVNATTTFKENVTMEKDLTVNGTINLTDLTLTGNLQVDGNTILGSDATDTLTVNATTTFKEDVTMEKDLTVLGNLNANIFPLGERQEVTGNVTLTNGVKLIAVTSATGLLTITLPTANTSSKNYYTIMDESGNASVNNIKIVPQGGETISGGNEVIINVNYGNVAIYNVPNSTKYFVIFTRP